MTILHERRLRVLQTSSCVSEHILAGTLIRAERLCARCLSGLVLCRGAISSVTIPSGIDSGNVFELVMGILQYTGLLSVTLVRSCSNIERYGHLLLIIYSMSRNSARLVFRTSGLVLRTLTRLWIRDTGQLIWRRCLELICGDSYGDSALLLTSTGEVRETIFGTIRVSRLWYVLCFIVGMDLTFFLCFGAGHSIFDCYRVERGEMFLRGDIRVSLIYERVYSIL